MGTERAEIHWESTLHLFLKPILSWTRMDAGGGYQASSDSYPLQGEMTPCGFVATLVLRV